MNFFAWFWSFCVVAGVLYTALIIWFLNGWKSITVFHRKGKLYTTKVSVIVPFNNEAATLESCIEGLIHQNIQTTEYEIILVDDQSTDKSTSIAREFADKYRRIVYLHSEQKGKKQALIHGVNKAIGELIVTTDADCVHKEFWLSGLVEYFELYKPNMIVGPVSFQTGKTLFQKFQQIEFVSLVASGAGAVGINHPIMCNGANLAFKKALFLELDDPLNLDYSSGDDVFLLHSMKDVCAEKIHFIKAEDSIVYTPALKNVKSFFKQRNRWVSKAPGYSDGDTKFTAFVVFATSFLLILGLGLIIYRVDFWKPVLFLFLLKTFVDIIFLYQVSGFFKQKALIKWVPIFEMVYGFYVTIAVLSLFFRKRK